MNPMAILGAPPSGGSRCPFWRALKPEPSLNLEGDPAFPLGSENTSGSLKRWKNGAGIVYNSGIFNGESK